MLLQPRLNDFAWVRSPALQPGRQIMRVELSDTIDARKEDRGQHDVESERPGCPDGNLDPTLGFDAESRRRRVTLKQKEEHLIALNSADRDAEDVLMKQTRENERYERRPNRRKSSAHRFEKVFTAELLRHPVISPPKVCGRPSQKGTADGILHDSTRKPLHRRDQVGVGK